MTLHLQKQMLLKEDSFISLFEIYTLGFIDQKKLTFFFSSWLSWNISTKFGWLIEEVNSFSSFINSFRWM